MYKLSKNSIGVKTAVTYNFIFIEDKIIYCILYFLLCQRLFIMHYHDYVMLKLN